MLGLLVSGRLVDTNFRQVDETHFVIDIVDPDNLNHVVVFLTGQVPFPEGTGGAVYCAWPSMDEVSFNPMWQYLGSISNEKPSAIFKVSRLKNQNSAISGPLGFGNHTPNQHKVAQVGISVESLSSLESLATAVTVSEASNVSSFLEFSQKMIESLFNYTSSFALSADEARVRSSETFVPFSSVQQWYTNFERRLHQNPTFWKK